MKTHSNWRLFPKHATLGDLKKVISNKYAGRDGELAYTVLLGEPYQFSTVVDFMIDLLEKRNDWVKQSDIRFAAEASGYHRPVVFSGLKRLESISNIGRKWEDGSAWFRCYPEREDGFDELNQKAIDDF
jgi:hypothetical protein